MKYWVLSLLVSVTPLFAEKNAETVFNEFYQRGVWDKNGFSKSGSQIEITQSYVVFLQDFMQRNNIRTVVDFGCGDWAFSRYIDWSGIQYIGYDVVQFVIERNQKLFGQPSIIFIHANALDIELPEADLLVCKDVLQHLPNADVKRLISQLHKFKHSLITNDVNPFTLSSKNFDIPRGWYHCLDLTKPPFNLPGGKVLTWEAGLSMKQVLHVDGEQLKN